MTDLIDIPIRENSDNGSLTPKLNYLEQVGIINTETNPHLYGYHIPSLEFLSDILSKPSFNTAAYRINTLDYESSKSICEPSQIEAVYADDFIGSTNFINNDPNAIYTIGFSQLVKSSFIKWYNTNYGAEFGEIHPIHMPGDGQIVGGSAFGIRALAKTISQIEPEIQVKDERNGVDGYINLRNRVRKSVHINPLIVNIDCTEEECWENLFCAASDPDTEGVMISAQLDTKDQIEKGFAQSKAKEKAIIQEDPSSWETFGGIVNYSEVLDNQLMNRIDSFQGFENTNQLDEYIDRIIDDFVSPINHTRYEDQTIDRDTLLEKHSIGFGELHASPDTVAVLFRDITDEYINDSEASWSRLRSILQKMSKLANKSSKTVISREGPNTVIILNPKDHEGQLRNEIIELTIECANELPNISIATATGKTLEGGNTILFPGLNKLTKIDIEGTDSNVALPIDLVPPSSVLPIYSEEDLKKGRVPIMKNPEHKDQTSTPPDLYQYVLDNLDVLIHPEGIHTALDYASLIELTMRQLDNHSAEPIDLIQKQNANLSTISHNANIRKILYQQNSNQIPEVLIHEWRIRYQGQYNELGYQSIDSKINAKELLSFMRFLKDQLVIDQTISYLLDFKDTAEMIDMMKYISDEKMLIYTTDQIDNNNLEQRILVPSDIRDSGINWEDTSEIASKILEKTGLYEISNPIERYESIINYENSQVSEFVAIAERILNAENLMESPEIALAIMDSKFKEGLSHSYSIDAITDMIHYTQDKEEYNSIRVRLRLHLLKMEFDDPNKVANSRIAKGTGTLNSTLNKMITMTDEFLELFYSQEDTTDLINDPIFVEILYRSAERLDSIKKYSPGGYNDQDIAMKSYQKLMDIFKLSDQADDIEAKKIYLAFSQDYSESGMNGLNEVLNELTNNPSPSRSDILRYYRIVDQVTQFIVRNEAYKQDQKIEIYKKSIDIHDIISQIHNIPLDIVTRYGGNLTEAKFYSILDNLPESIPQIKKFALNNLVRSIRTKEMRLIFLSIMNLVAVEEALVGIDDGNHVDIKHHVIKNIVDDFLDHNGSYNFQTKRFEDRFPGNEDLKIEFLKSLKELIEFYQSKYDLNYERKEDLDTQIEARKSMT